MERFFCFLLAIAALSVADKNPLPVNPQTSGAGMRTPPVDITISGRVTDTTTNEALAGCTRVLRVDGAFVRCPRRKV